MQNLVNHDPTQHSAELVYKDLTENWGTYSNSSLNIKTPTHVMNFSFPLQMNA